MKHKDQAFQMFNIYKSEVENQKGKKIKILRSQQILKEIMLVQAMKGIKLILPLKLGEVLELERKRIYIQILYLHNLLFS